MTYEEFDKRCDELENAPLPERKTFFADVLAGETEKTDVRMMAYFRYALLFYREGDFRTAREILEPFIIDYKSYRYRPEIIACFNLVGVVAYYVQEYALSRFYIHEGLKIAREHSEVSRYAYEYNNLAVTYLAQQDYGKALEAIREAEKNLPVSDEVMHAYIYRNLAEICCHLDRLDEAKDALAKCLAYRGREILPEEVRIVSTLLTYKSGDTAGYKRCCAELREHLPQLHAHSPSFDLRTLAFISSPTETTVVRSTSGADVYSERVMIPSDLPPILSTILSGLTAITLPSTTSPVRISFHSSLSNICAKLSSDISINLLNDIVWG